MAMAYLYQAMDILKQSAPLQNNPSPSVNNFSPQAPFFPQNPNNHVNQQFASNPNNQANQNNDFTTKLDTLLGKYPLVPIQYLGIPSDGKGNLLDWTKEPLFL